MLLSLRKNGLTFLFKEVRVFKATRAPHESAHEGRSMFPSFSSGRTPRERSHDTGYLHKSLLTPPNFSGTKPCPSIPCFFCFTKEKAQTYQGFSLTAEPTKSLEKTEKIPNNQGNSLLKINQGNPNNQGMEGQGNAAIFLKR